MSACGLVLRRLSSSEEGNGSNIWSHKWNLGNHARYYDGVWIDSYAINPEKQNAGYSGIPGLTHIGVISHEFGHALGLGHYKVTDYPIYTADQPWINASIMYYAINPAHDDIAKPKYINKENSNSH